MALRRVEYVGYAFGDVGNNLTFSMVAAFLLIYYTDVAGISAATAGILFLIARVWGGVTDLVAGRTVDLTSTRWGRFRPFIAFGAIPLLVLLVLLFSIPSGLSPGLRTVWAFVSYLLFSLAYSFVNIPYGSLAAAMTQSPDERAKLSSSRSIGASLTILAIAVVVSPQISAASNLQRTLTLTTIGFAVIGYLSYLFCFSTARENIQVRAAKVSIGQTVSMLRQNRPLLLLCLATLLFLTGMFSLQTVAVFYARDILGSADLYIVLTLIQTLAMVGAAMLVPSLAGSMGKRNTYLVAALVVVVGGAGVAFAPTGWTALSIIAYGVLGLGTGTVNTLIFAFQADTVDYGEWRSGLRAEASNYALLSFTRKAGQGVGGWAAAFALSLGGYVATSGSQPQSALTAIRVAAGAIPAVLAIAAGVVMLVYPLSEKVFRTLVAELAERHARAGVEERES